MTTPDLDDVDRRLLNELQENARYTAVELGEAVGVSDNTIHNRMERLESAGVITGYSAGIDPHRAGFDLRFIFTCTERISRRADAAADIMAIPGVTEVIELMTGHDNIIVEALGSRDEDITRIAEQIDELGVEINDEKLVRDRHQQSLDFVELAEEFDMT